jgi:N-acetylglucosamine-6-phosphate deacetylase
MLASLVSSPYELMRKATEAYAPLVADGVIAGVHFEGPYLSAARCGAQNPAFLRDPSRRAAELIAWARGGPDGHDRARAAGALDASRSRGHG